MMKLTLLPVLDELIGTPSSRNFTEQLAQHELSSELGHHALTDREGHPRIVAQLKVATTTP